MAIEKIVDYSQFLGEEGPPHLRGLVEKHQDPSGGRGSEGKIWMRDFIVVSTESNGRGKANRLQIGSFE